MRTMPFHRYQPYPPVDLPDRKWPSRTITIAPIWCSVDLRDGNQALINPMSVETKCRMFDLLVKMGFKQIEVGFPAASQIEFDFIRKLINEGLIPEDVTIQVLTQARKDIITRTFEGVVGAKDVIVHLYNSTSTLQRRVVFNMDERGVSIVAMEGTELIKKLCSERPETNWTFQYSPESFTGTELAFARDVCTTVTNVWRPTPSKKMIINLPATVEMSTPNVYADRIEWMHRNMNRRDSVIISLHPHNDRGTGIAATEQGLMAGGERVEGTLFGNGERTGNVDIVTLAGNLMSQGVDPRLDFSDITQIVRVVEECTNIRVHPRHPYAGELAYTAFSGSHQDAIKKGLAALQTANSPYWEVPYLPINPRDIGRVYRPIRINSQSGKGGIAYVMEEEHGLQLPRGLQIDFASVVQKVTDATGKELLPPELLACFEQEFMRRMPLDLVEYIDAPATGGRRIKATLLVAGVEKIVEGTGNGLVSAFVNALNDAFAWQLTVNELHQDSTTGGTDAEAVSFIPVHVPRREPFWGVGKHTDTARAHLLAVISAINRSGIFGAMN